MNIDAIIKNVTADFNDDYTKLFEKYNKLYFDNKLKLPRFKELHSPIKTKIGVSNGYYSYSKEGGELAIFIEEDKHNKILLHEMCHIAQITIDKEINSAMIKNTIFGHTKTWQKWMKKCNQKIDEIYLNPKEEEINPQIGDKAYFIYKDNWEKILVLSKSE